MNRSTRDCACRPEQLPLYHYGELQAEERLRMEEHLQGCLACQRELSELQALLGKLPAADLELSPEALRAFRQRVDDRLRHRSRRPVRPVLGWSFAASAAVLLALVLRGPVPGPIAEPGLPKTVQQAGGELQGLPDPELLLDLELLENFDLLQELKGLG